jgi:hypothetical protein
MGHSRKVSKNQSTAHQVSVLSESSDKVTQRILSLFTVSDQMGDNPNIIRNLRK